jgi:hypothetical protein
MHAIGELCRYKWDIYSITAQGTGKEERKKIY